MNNFTLKGDRNYLRGIDIYTYFIKTNFKNIKIQFLKKIYYQPKLINYTKKNTKKICCIIEFNNKKKKYKLCLINSKKKFSQRILTEDKILIKNFKLYKNSITCDFKSEIPTINILSFMFKLYHNKKIKNSKWQLTKLKLLNKLSEKPLKKYSIKIKRKTLNKFTIMSINQNNKLIGEVEHIATE